MLTNHTFSCTSSDPNGRGGREERDQWLDSTLAELSFHMEVHNVWGHQAVQDLLFVLGVHFASQFVYLVNRGSWCVFLEIRYVKFAGYFVHFLPVKYTGSKGFYLLRWCRIWALIELDIRWDAWLNARLWPFMKLLDFSSVLSSLFGREFSLLKWLEHYLTIRLSVTRIGRMPPTATFGFGGMMLLPDD